MGTRADFYIGKGADAQWIGSIAWDGCRDGIPDQILLAKSDEEFCNNVLAFLDGRDDGTLPDDGWPWPWNDSRLTDCHYWFFDGRCWEGRGECARFGEVYVPADEPQPDWDSGDEEELYDTWMTGREAVVFPDMTALKNTTLGPRSGVILVGG